MLFMLSGCENSGQPIASQQQYFDVKGYFNQEAKRLSAKNPIVDKTVNVNHQTEQRKTRIEDWAGELANFTDADINKTAWAGLFTVRKTDSAEIYQSNDEKVLVKTLRVQKKSGKVTGISIILNTNNYLYSSADTLNYLPDSLYEIKKKQHITLLNEKIYQVKGTFR